MGSRDRGRARRDDSLGARSEYWKDVFWLARRAVGKGLGLAGLPGLALVMVPCGKIIALPDNDRLWRRFINSKNYWTWDDDLNRYIPNRHYLKFNPDLSSYWNWHLAMHGLGAESVLEGDDRYTIVGELSIGKMRRRDFIVHHTPRKDTKIGCAHSSVDWPLAIAARSATTLSKEDRKALLEDQKALQTWIAREFSWIYGGSPMAKPDGA